MNPANRCTLSYPVPLKEPERDEDLGQIAEPLVDVTATIITHTQAAKLVKPTEGSLNHPAIHTQATPVGRPPLGQLRVDPPVAQLLPLLFVVKTPVAHRMVRSLAGVARLAGDGGNGIHQRHGQVGIRRVRRDRIGDQGHALAVGDDGVFAPQFRAIDGAGAGFFTPTHGADVTRVHDEPLEVDPVGLTEVGQQDRVDLVPDAGGLPSRKRFQPVMPQPQPISWGKSSQGRPVLRMKMIPVRTLRSSSGGRPPLGPGG